MPKNRVLTRVVATFIALAFSVNCAFAAGSIVSQSPTPGDKSDLPVYMQLMVYVSTLLTEGKEVPKALLNKIEAYYKTGK